MLAAWPWNPGKGTPPRDENNATEGGPVHEGLTGDNDHPIPPHGETPGKVTTKRTTTIHPPEHMPDITTTEKVPIHEGSPQEVDENDGEGGGDPHHPHPGGEGHHHHPHPGNGHHHHPHEDPETTTPVWESERTTPRSGYAKGGGGVKGGRKGPAKGLGPRIGEEEEDPSAEWVNKTQPENPQTQPPRGGKQLKIVDTSQQSEAKPKEGAPSTGETEKAPTTPATPSPDTEMHLVPVTRNDAAEGKVTRPADEVPTGEGSSEGERLRTEMQETTTASSTVHAIETEGDATERLTPHFESYVEEDKTKALEENSDICQTSTCKSLAARMLAFMDHSIDPCDDLYEYACGGMKTSDNSNWISEEVPEYNAWSRIQDMLSGISQSSPLSHQKFKSFHDSCIFYDNHLPPNMRKEKVHDLLARLGKFYSDKEWKESPGNLTLLIGTLMKHHFSPLFDILLDVDATRSKFTIKLTAPVIKSPFGDPDGKALNGWISETCKQSATEKPMHKTSADFNKRNEEYIECNSKYEQYLKEVKDSIEVLKIIKYENENVTQKLITDTVLYLDVLLSDTEVKSPQNPGEKRRILLAKEFHMYTLRELNEKFPLIEWVHLISMLLGHNITEETEIQVYFEDYFQSFFKNISNSGLLERQLYNALMAMFTHELYYGLVISRSPCNRKAYCLNVATQLMDPIASALFLQSFDASQLSNYQSKITSVFLELLTTLKTEISKLEWTDKNSQILALDKLHNLKLYADGGVSVFLNEPFLEAQFAKVAANKTYMENAIDLMIRYRERMYEVYRKNPSEPEQIWTHFLLPFREQGIVIYGLNSIVIPYGRLFKPFFSEDYPWYMQMSGLGFMIAHEIWHQFDTTGVKYDSKGHRGNKFSEDTMAAINKTAKCSTEQLDVLVNDDTKNGEKYSFRLNPAITLNERMVDMGGAHLAFKTTWKTARLGSSVASLPWTSLTPKQLYFLSLAQNFCTKSSVFDYAISLFEDEHLPPFMRVNDIALNSVEFREAFSCPAPKSHGCQPFTLS